MSSSLDDALRDFEAAEANLAKAERLWAEIEEMIPEGIEFSGGRGDAEYDDRCRVLREILAGLPAIDGFTVRDCLLGLNAIAQMRLDARELGEVYVSTEESIFEQGKQLREYRFKFRSKRRELVRRAVLYLIDRIEEALGEVSEAVAKADPGSGPSQDDWERLRGYVNQIDTLLGSSCTRPERWGDLLRHLSFAQPHDFRDICDLDWPAVRQGLARAVYGDGEPLPVRVKDLGELTEAQPTGPVATKLHWEGLTAEGFERLVYCLISDAEGYENPGWLTKTNAPDRGRDLSITLAQSDPLSGLRRSRVIIQCRHWLDRSVTPRDVGELRDQMKLWEPPRVDILVIATSGRFTSDAVALIEKHNQSDSALHIEMWPESHLERLLAARPALIAEFHLR